MLRKNNKRLLRINLSQKKNSIFAYDFKSLTEDTDKLMLFASVVLSIILLSASLMVFVINQKLKYDYKTKQLSIKNYQNELNLAKTKINGVKSQYLKLKQEVDLFKYENKIFKNYYNYYKDISSFASVMLSNFKNNDVYIKSLTLQIKPDDISPSSISVFVDLDSLEDASNVLSGFNYKNNCYDFGIKGICINSITQRAKMITNNAGFIYFNNIFQLQGIITKEVKKHEK